MSCDDAFTRALAIIEREEEARRRREAAGWIGAEVLRIPVTSPDRTNPVFVHVPPLTEKQKRERTIGPISIRIPVEFVSPLGFNDDALDEWLVTTGNPSAVRNRYACERDGADWIDIGGEGGAA